MTHVGSFACVAAIIEVSTGAISGLNVRRTVALGWCAVRIDGVVNSPPAPKHPTGRLRSARLGFVRRNDRRVSTE